MRNRFRRLRGTQAVRDLVAETVVTKKDLIYPMFVIEGDGIMEPIPSMPGVFRYSIDNLDEIMEQVKASGISGILLFGVPAHKDEVGSEAYNPDGIVQKAIRYIKEKYPELIVIADICLCEYTDHGHCGVLNGHEILNDETLPLLARMALTCVQAGADMVAPSDMMDGDVEAIRDLLDENGYANTPIMGYSAKYASGYYSPFRDAAGSAPSFGDRKSYQMDIRNGKEGIRELENDVDMGADILMVKPGLAYLDVLKESSLTFDYPIAVYNVSGEYSMVKAAAQNGWIDEKRIVMENMISFKRAGASIIITYHALDVAKWLDE
ncbi:MAG: porphobilinogen synthase [Eubacteriaceae bacterium]|nr:porphobilinogen synthase [Eubacteriaceae bacterium]